MNTTTERGSHSMVDIHLQGEWVNSVDYCDNGIFVLVPFTSTSQKMSGCI